MKRDTILIVDDMAVNRTILRTMFEKEYNLLEAENGEQALMLLNHYHETIAVMLLDLMMPIKDGYQVMAELAQSDPKINVPIVVVTAQDSADNIVHVFDLGAWDVIPKYFQPHLVKRRVQNIIDLNFHQLHLEELIEDQANKLQESEEVLLDALSSVIEHRSVESDQHVLRIRMFTKVLLEETMRSYPEYGLDQRTINVISRATALHDIGKISIPDAILNKPGKLTAEEFEIMKTHSEKGCDILAGLNRMHDQEFLRYAYDICYYHHERWDGGGYPNKLKEDNIPIYAQVVGIADAYDALTSERVYKQTFSAETAFVMILNGDCGVFSPKILECFKSVQKSFVELSNKYSDNIAPNTGFNQLEIPVVPRQIDHQSTLQLGQMKYFSILRYINSTVMEVDMETGIFHLVYIQNEDFESLRSSSIFGEAISIFAKNSIHPEDRPLVEVFLGSDMNTFLKEGLMKYSQKYRVFHRASGNYLWYEATVLRINIENHRQKKILLIWQQIHDMEEVCILDTNPINASLMLQNLLISILQCRNDQWMTVIHANEDFIALLGYTRQEIEQMFQNHYLAMIHTDDQKKVLRQLRKKLCDGNSLELEYRVIAKDGRIIWLLDKCQIVTGDNGIEYLNNVLIDITQTKQAQEELRLTLERHEIIMDQSDNIIFEWIINENRLSYSTNWKKRFGYEPIEDQIDIRIPQASHLFPDDVPVFKQLLNEVLMGMPYVESELRIANAEGRYLWCQIRATTQFDNIGKPIKAVGVILDIDHEKRRSQALIDQVERDTLTHFYNKEAARRKIENLLEQREPTEQVAMFMIDIDNFKLLNDSRGHMFGDAVLVEIASQLRKLFRFDDIISRIGGDEFMVFVHRLPDLKILEERAAKVIQVFQDIFKDSLTDCQLTCSIGVACCPEDGTDFSILYQRCDQALYRAKHQGKNQYVLYDRLTMAKSFGLNPEQLLIASTRIESDDSTEFDKNGIVQQAFRELYKSDDIEQAINSILDLVGRTYNVSRVYIFEDTEDGLYCNNTFEWCNEGIVAEKHLLQNIEYAMLGGNYQENFSEDGIFYCPDITKLSKELQEILCPQAIYSLLQCAVHNDGKFVGYVGFDDCVGKRIWTQSQIDALTFVSELLSTFLLKKRAQDRALATAANLRMIMDNQNSWIYVIDPDTYELYYINAKTYDIAPDARIGMYCYQAFFARSAPCVQCPARNIRQIINQTIEVYNPLLKVWSMADASFIHWGDRDACLLSCHDITPYKKVALKM